MTRQRQIVDAAGRVIVKYGSEHITIKTIAAETGITEGAIYRHFKSKRDILMLLVDYVEKLLLQDLHSDGFKSAKADSFHAVMQRHVGAVERRNGFTFLIIAEIISLADSALNKKALNVINKYILEFEKFLIEGQKKGMVKRGIDTRMAATLFFHLIQGLVNVWALNSYSFDIKTEFSRLWNVYQGGIVPGDLVADANSANKYPPHIC